MLRLARAAAAAFLVVALASCRMDSAKPLIVAHRGASAAAPENTLAAFRLAWKQGADAIEGDFRLTADGEMVCLHDPTTERTGDRALTAADVALADLKEVDVGAWKGPAWAGERIPTLLEVLRTVPRHGRIFIELKSGPECLGAVQAAIGRSRLRADQVVLICFDERVVQAARRRLPEHRALWITAFERDGAGGWRPAAAEILATLDRCGAAGLDAQARPEAISEELRRGLAERGLDLAFWTVDEPEPARALIALGAGALTTNRPAELRRALGL
ncbi:MAG: glycerophosphodiester phosphodiesterase [Planctomycetota bacterium]|nr:MAG: glycerophosphodiester phosphodiesterase [Planctomycetota bacterium]